MGFAHEVDLVAAAREADLLTTPYVFSADDARAMTAAGADVVVCHMGLTTGGSIGAETAKSLDDCVALVDEWSAAAREVRDDVLVLVHGGPVSAPRTPPTSWSAPDLPRLLRRQQHGAPAHRGGADRPTASSPDRPHRRSAMPEPCLAIIPADAADVGPSSVTSTDCRAGIPRSRQRARDARRFRGAVRRLTLGDGGEVRRSHRPRRHRTIADLRDPHLPFPVRLYRSTIRWSR